MDVENSASLKRKLCETDSHDNQENTEEEVHSSNCSNSYSGTERNISHVNPTVPKYLNVTQNINIFRRIADCFPTVMKGNDAVRTFNTIVNQQEAEMVLMSSSGHLQEYRFCNRYQEEDMSCLSGLFDMKIEKTRRYDTYNAVFNDFSDKIETLKDEVNDGCDGVIIWTTWDREGENITFEIIRICTKIKPKLRLYRAILEDGMSPSDVLENLQNPYDYEDLSIAADVRQEIDFRTGRAFTRLILVAIDIAKKSGVESYGSCQFPILGYIVDHEEKRKKNTSKPCLQIKMVHTNNQNVTTIFFLKRGFLYDENTCKVIVQKCKLNPEATVKSVQARKESQLNRPRPIPLTSIELKKNISKIFGINTKDTMEIAKKLYNQQLISCPHTKTNIFPESLNLRDLVEKQLHDTRWCSFAQKILDEEPEPSRGIYDQGDSPIYPKQLGINLSDKESKIYEYIVRHFLACVQKDAVERENNVVVEIAGEEFEANVLMIEKFNYLDVYPYEKNFTSYCEGDKFEPNEIKEIKPNYLAVKELYSLMEKYYIGTVNTRTKHIDNIVNRRYAEYLENGTYIKPTEVGTKLIEWFREMDLGPLTYPDLRRKFFVQDLEMISKGAKRPEKVLAEQIDIYQKFFETMKKTSF